MKQPNSRLGFLKKSIRTIWIPFGWPIKIISWPIRAVVSLFSRIIRFFQTAPQASGQDLPETILNVIQKPVLLAPHLNALRKTLLRSILYLLLGISLSGFFSQEILAFFAQPMAGGLNSLIGVDITESVSAVVRVVLLTGFALALPLICIEIWWFVSPALTGKQRLISLLIIPVVFLFFVAGMLFAYFLLLPNAIPVLLDFMGLQTVPRPNSYFPFVANLMFWMGISFEFPLVIMVLARMGLITAQKLLRAWRYAIIIITIFSAVITTTTDPWNMGLTAAPMIALYFISVILALLTQKRQ